MTVTNQFAAHVGLDWADKKHDVCVQFKNGERVFHVIKHTAEALDVWLAGFQRDVLMVNDNVPDAVKQPFKTALFLRVWHDIKNVNPVFTGACQQMAGDYRLITGSGFQTTLGLNGDHGAAGEGNQTVRPVTDLVTTEEGCAITIYPPGCAFLLKDDPSCLIIKVMLQRPAGNF